VPVKNGIYKVTTAPLRGIEGYEDDLGEYGLATWFER